MSSENEPSSIEQQQQQSDIDEAQKNKNLNKSRKSSGKKVNEPSILTPPPPLPPPPPPPPPPQPAQPMSEPKKLEEPTLSTKLPLASSIFDESINQLSDTIESLISSKNEKILKIDNSSHNETSRIEQKNFDLFTNKETSILNSDAVSKKSILMNQSEQQQNENHAKIKYVVEKIKTKLNSTRKLESEKSDSEAVNKSSKSAKTSRSKSSVSKSEENEVQSGKEKSLEQNDFGILDFGAKLEQNPVNIDLKSSTQIAQKCNLYLKKFNLKVGRLIFK